jgi:hypothetical protein
LTGCNSVGTQLQLNLSGHKNCVFYELSIGIWHAGIGSGVEGVLLIPWGLTWPKFWLRWWAAALQAGFLPRASSESSAVKW